MQKIKSLCLLFIVLSALSACSSQPHTLQKVEQNKHNEALSSVSEKGWYFARFYPVWPDDEPRARFYLDTLIADRVIAPILLEYRDDIDLWRFHRRASRRNGGKHRFSFLFYTDQLVAQKIISAIDTSSSLETLTKLEIIESYTLDRTFPSTLNKIHMTSDGNWPMSIQRSWPYYIMGVSEMWLDLILQLKNIDTLHLTSESLQAEYKLLDNEITELWKEYGQHAYLHHLNALYGYEAMKLREQRWIRF